MLANKQQNVDCTVCCDFYQWLHFQITIFYNIQAAVDEKKKKQDDKLKKAQLLREAQEKEKADKQRKLLLVSTVKIWSIAVKFMHVFIQIFRCMPI